MSKDNKELEIALLRGARAYVFGQVKMSDLAKYVAEEDVQRNLAEGKLGAPANETELNRAVEITQRYYTKHASAQIMAELVEESAKVDLERGRVYFPETLREFDSYQGLADCLREAVNHLQHQIVTQGEDYLLPLHSGLDNDRKAAVELLETLHGKDAPKSVSLGQYEFDVEKPSRGKRSLSYGGEMPDDGKRVLSDINFLIDQALLVRNQREKHERKREMERASEPSMTF